MVEENRTEYGYHLFAHYHDYHDIRYRAEFFEITDVSGLENKIRELLLEGFDPGIMYVILGQGKTFKTTEEVVTDVELIDTDR